MRTSRLLAGLCLLLPALGCRQDMHDQPKYEAYEASDFFLDGRASRAPVPGTVARGWLREDAHLYRGIGPDGQFATDFPMPVDAALLARGHERFDIYCSPCHGRTADGEGMIVRRGFKQPQSFHQPRLRQVAVGYFFDVMTNGFGEMSSYAAQVPVEDRWAIAAYIRALQLSRAAPAELLSEADLDALAASETAPPAEEEGQ